jgi:hypothetical protein
VVADEAVDSEADLAEGSGAAEEVHSRPEGDADEVSNVLHCGGTIIVHYGFLTLLLTVFYWKILSVAEYPK